MTQKQSSIVRNKVAELGTKALVDQFQHGKIAKEEESIVKDSIVKDYLLKQGVDVSKKPKTEKPKTESPKVEKPKKEKSATDHIIVKGNKLYIDLLDPDSNKRVFKPGDRIKFVDTKGRDRTGTISQSQGVDADVFKVDIDPIVKATVEDVKIRRQISIDKSKTKSAYMKKLILANSEIKLHDLNAKLIKKGFHKAYASEMQRIHKQIEKDAAAEK